MEQIKINYEELATEICKMRSLETGSDYLIRTAVYSFLNVGKGGMFNSVNDLYKQLNEFERKLRELIKKNNKVLIQAGVDFEEAEHIASKLYDLV